MPTEAAAVERRPLGIDDDDKAHDGKNPAAAVEEETTSETPTGAEEETTTTTVVNDNAVAAAATESAGGGGGADDDDGGVGGGDLPPSARPATEGKDVAAAEGEAASGGGDDDEAGGAADSASPPPPPAAASAGTNEGSAEIDVAAAVGSAVGEERRKRTKKSPRSSRRSPPSPEEEISAPRDPLDPFNEDGTPKEPLPEYVPPGDRGEDDEYDYDSDEAAEAEVAGKGKAGGGDGGSGGDDGEGKGGAAPSKKKRKRKYRKRVKKEEPPTTHDDPGAAAATTTSSSPPSKKRKPGRPRTKPPPPIDPGTGEPIRRPRGRPRIHPVKPPKPPPANPLNGTRFPRHKGPPFTYRLEQIRMYHTRNGHARIPSHYPPDLSLGKWVANQRAFYRAYMLGKPSVITKERIEALEEAGFEFQVGRWEDVPTWPERLDQLRRYKATYGHLRVPQNYVDPRGNALGRWVKAMRTQMRQWKDGKKSPMTDQRVKDLEELEFEWGVSVKPRRKRRERLGDGTLVEREEVERREREGLERRVKEVAAAAATEHGEAAARRDRAAASSAAATATQVNDVGVGTAKTTAAAAMASSSTPATIDEDCFRDADGFRYLRYPAAAGIGVAARPQAPKDNDDDAAATTAEDDGPGEDDALPWEPEAYAAGESVDVVGATTTNGATHAAPPPPPAPPAVPGPAPPATAAAPAAPLADPTFVDVHFPLPPGPIVGTAMTSLAAAGRGAGAGGSGKGEGRTRKNPPPPTWDERLDELRAYKEKYGHCNVPIYSINPKLGYWVSKQRTLHKAWKEGKSCSLTNERVDRLNELGFIWDGRKARQLLVGKGQGTSRRDEAETDESKVRAREEARKGREVEKERKRKEQEQKALEVAELLRGEGDDKPSSTSSPATATPPTTPAEKGRSRKNASWDARLAQLRAFKAVNGHCRVSQGDDPRLLQWVKNQRTQYRHLRGACRPTSMTQDRAEKLEALGFEWEAKRGRPRTSRGDDDDDGGGGGTGKGGSSGAGAASSGAAGGVDTKFRSSNGRRRRSRKHPSWEDRLEQLRLFKATFGHCRVGPRDADPTLGKWVMNQRSFHRAYALGKKSPMTAERVAALEALGFEFTVGRWRGGRGGRGGRVEASSAPPPRQPEDTMVVFPPPSSPGRAED